MRIAFDLSTAMGIGDAVCGLYAAAGLAKAGHSVVLSTRHHGWLEGCQSHVGIGDFGKAGLDASVRYEEQLIAQKSDVHGRLNRAQWYIDNIADKRGQELKQIRPVVPEFQFPILPMPVKGPFIVLNPFSAHTARVWKAENWRDLAILISAAGITPVAVGSTRDAKDLQKIFSKVKGAWFFWSQTPAWVRSALKQSIGFVGNDSGMAHIAASLRVPTVAIMSHLRSSFVFPPGVVTGVLPDERLFACRFCGWQTQLGYRHGNPCLPACAALQSISVSAVFDAVRQTCIESNQEAIAA